MRLGIFGGTFDPVHQGHLIVAEQCREQARLDQVWFVPAARPPHKPGQQLSAFHHRVEMLELALAGQPAFRVDQLEKNRPGPSYTSDTLGEFRARLPDAELCLILGADCLPDLPSWHEPARIVELAHLLFVGRPGWSLWPPAQLGAALQLANVNLLRQEFVQSPLVDISSRDIRLRAAEDRSIRFLVPRAVECYVETHNLYRRTT